MNFWIIAAGLFTVLVLAGWPWWPTIVRNLFTMIGIRLACVGIVAWDQPKADAKGMYLNFTGLEIGHRFIGVVTSQEAYVEKQIRRIIVDNV